MIYVAVILIVIIIVVSVILFINYNRKSGIDNLVLNICPRGFTRVGDQCLRPCLNKWDEGLDERGNRVCYSPCDDEPGSELTKDNEKCKYVGCLKGEKNIDGKCYKGCVGGREMRKLVSGSVVCMLPCPDGYMRFGRYCHKPGAVRKYIVYPDKPALKDSIRPIIRNGVIYKCKSKSKSTEMDAKLNVRNRYRIMDSYNWECPVGMKMGMDMKMEKGCSNDLLEAGYKYNDHFGCVKCKTDYSDIGPKVKSLYSCRLGDFDAKALDAVYMRDYDREKKRRMVYPKDIKMKN